jgi:serine/threonine-protein kinase
MSPDQIINFSNVTAAADQYSVGLVAYKMFTGDLPFKHAETVPLLMMHVQQTPGPPRKLNPQIPVELEQIILRLLEKEPSKRFESCRELAEQFKFVLERYC